MFPSSEPFKEIHKIHRVFYATKYKTLANLP